MQLFLEVLEQAGISAWWTDLDTREFRLTPGFWRQLGYDREMTCDFSAFCTMIHPMDLQQFEDTISSRWGVDGDPWPATFRFCAANGSWRVLETRGRAIDRNADGRAQTLGGTIMDLTDEYARQERARVDNARLVAAQERAGAGIWEVDLRTGQLVLDERSLKMHGLPIDHPMPMSQSDWAETLDGNADDVIDAFRRAIETRTLFSHEYSTQAGKVWIHGFGSAVYAADEGRMPVRVVGLNIDITERRTAERLIEQMRGELVHLARLNAMGSMASTIAHELNQPLAATTNYLSVADMLLDRSDFRGAQSAVRKAAQATVKAGDIIRRIREGTTSPNSSTRTLELKPVLQSGIRLATIDASQRGIKIETRLKSGLSVDIDPIQIEQVIINLIRNAMDALHDSSTRRVVIRSFIKKSDVIVEVSDSGRGIHPDMIDNVFETSATSKENGMGIGLSICRTIVEAHHGRIELASSTGRGTRIRFRLPLVDGRTH
jgi:signal transduction histidine kinase